MDGWSTEFPLPPFDRAQAPDLDIDSLLDFASQSLLQPVFEQPGALKTPPLSLHVGPPPVHLLYAVLALQRLLDLHCIASNIELAMSYSHGCHIGAVMRDCK